MQQGPFQTEREWQNILAASEESKAGKPAQQKASHKVAEPVEGALTTCPATLKAAKGWRESLQQTLKDFQASRQESLKLATEDPQGNRRKLRSEKEKRAWLQVQAQPAVDCLSQLSGLDARKTAPQQVAAMSTSNGSRQQALPEREAVGNGTTLPGEGYAADFWIYSLLAGLSLSALLSLLWRYSYTEDDSANFQKALEIWLPFLATQERCNSPREIKRFLNRARYAALRLRPGAGRDDSDWDRLMRKWGFKPALEADSGLTVAEHKIVALLVLYTMLLSEQQPKTELKKLSSGFEKGFFKIGFNTNVLDGYLVPSFMRLFIDYYHKNFLSVMSSEGEIVFKELGAIIDIVSEFSTDSELPLLEKISVA